MGRLDADATKLIEQILEDAIGAGDALPLAYFIMALLEVTPGGFTIENYKKLGGIQGAIERTAEDIWSRFVVPAQIDDEMKRFFVPGMISIDAAGNARLGGIPLSDTGIGIPPDIIAKVFEPFFTTKEVGKGTGLGLSTVYGIVKQTEGFIFTDSEVGNGTSFVIYLPVHHAAMPDPAVPVRVEPVKTDWGTGTILLVEDEAMVRDIAERALTSQRHRVVTANDGEDGLDKINSEAEFDLVICNVVMPKLDGPSFSRVIRERFPALPIIMMSGYSPSQLRKSLDTSEGFLQKPFSIQQLIETAGRAIQSQG
jgi:CheY-like chemotaxis protein